SKVYSSAIGEILDARAKQGQVRHCHGDLHLRNIVLIDGIPILFDAIEFDQDLAEIDVLYDLAFLLMDLDHRDLRPLANVVLNRYLDLMDDTAGIACLPLFISVRAAVRAHVSAAVAMTQASAVERESLMAEAQTYLATARASLNPPAPALVAIGGLSGSGKSLLARELAPAFGAVPGSRIARSDVLRKRLAGVSILDKLGPEGYTADMTQKTYDRVYRECEAALQAGQWAIADAVFAKPEQRAAIEQIARHQNVPFYGLWLEAPAPVLKTRVDARRSDASDADRTIVEQQMGYDLGGISWRRIDSGLSLAKTVKTATQELRFGGDRPGHQKG
ncbi:MAG: AAA family ATPase, partial [Rhodospirillales bacterium]